LTLVKIELTKPVVPVEKFADTIGIGDRIIALGYSSSSGWINAVGRTTTYVSGASLQSTIACDIRTEPWMQGAPVINTKCELVAIVGGTDAQGICELIPAIGVKDILEDFLRQHTS